MHLPKPTEGGNYTPPPAGTHVAVCIGFIDLGTQKVVYAGEEKHQHKVMIKWELSHEKMEDGQLFTVSKRYTWSMHKKATLRQHLEAWRGKPFIDEDFEGDKAFNIKNIIGKPCTLTITMREGDDKKTYTDVSSVGPMMKGMAAPERMNFPVYVALTKDGFEPTMFGGLSDRLKEIISASPEYRDLHNGDQASKSHSARGDMDDEIPF